VDIHNVIDLESDRLYPVNDLIQERLGKRISPATLWSWRLKGIKAGDRRVRLECVRLAGTWCTTPKALAVFIWAQSVDPSAIDDPSESPERSERTSQRLAAAGLLRGA